MCDYSLEHVESRPAAVGDKLVSQRFGHSMTRGLAAVGNREVAVCLMPGTEIAFEQDVLCEPAIGFFPVRKIAERVARFRQIDLDQPTTHHDALEFPSGQIVKLSRLVEGQVATVLQLPAAARATTDVQTTLEARRSEPV